AVPISRSISLSLSLPLSLSSARIRILLLPVGCCARAKPEWLGARQHDLRHSFRDSHSAYYRHPRDHFWVYGPEGGQEVWWAGGWGRYGRRWHRDGVYRNRLHGAVHRALYRVFCRHHLDTRPIS